MLKKGLSWPAGLAATSILLAGCGGVNKALVDKKTQKEYYQVFDIKTDADSKKVAKSVASGIQENVNSLNESWPIPPQETPAEPGRFELQDPLKGTRMGALAGGAGKIGFKTVNCDGAVWTGKAVRDTSAKTQVNLCLWPYKDGYHLDFYMQYKEKDQGLIKSAASSVAHAAVGSPKEWVAELVYDTVEQVQADVTKVKIKKLEGRPELKERPWVANAGGS